jgi:16S rRNA (cytidine1402-2'-O)-methyltransferase
MSTVQTPGSFTGTLILAGTPLGNPQDASARFTALLVSADLVAAEDTRRLRRLIADLGVRREGDVISFYEGVEAQRLPRILSVLGSGGTVALVTDAGMPSISDPGYRAVQAALAESHRVSALPGPSAVTTALALSGLPCDRFCFEGFLPRKGGERRRRLQELSAEARTLVFFESPNRVVVTLEELSSAFGPTRPAALCREISKVYEEVLRGSLSEISAQVGKGVRGEVTLVVEGSRGPAPLAAADLAEQVAALARTGVTRKEAIHLVATSTRTPKRDVFDAVVQSRSDL